MGFNAGNLSVIKNMLYTSICEYKMILCILRACQSTPWGEEGGGQNKDLGHNAESLTFTVTLNKLITPKAEFPDTWDNNVLFTCSNFYEIQIKGPSKFYDPY